MAMDSGLRTHSAFLRTILFSAVTVAACTTGSAEGPTRDGHDGAPSTQATITALANRAGRHTPDASGPTSAIAACAAWATRVLPGPQLSPQTGERGVIYTVTNRGPRNCSLSGYAEVVLRNDVGAALPFRYERGGGPYVTGEPSRAVVLAPGASAHFVLAKYRCDLGPGSAVANRRWLATTASVRLPGQSLVRELPAAFPSTAYAIAYCPLSGDELGNTIAVSPVEARLQDLVAG